MKGRKPTPNNLKRLASADGEHDSGGRKIVPEMQPLAGAPERPAILTGEAADEWDRIVSEVSPTGVLTVADRGALLIHCLNWALMIDAFNQIGKSTIVKVNGQPQKNPHLKLFQEQSAAVMKSLTEFGGTPSSRSRIPAAAATTKPQPTTTDRFFIRRAV